MDAHALCRQWQDFAGGFPRTATGDGVAGTDGLAEPPPLHDLAHHRRLLDRVLYKTRNSHRATAYYQQLHAVQRLLRRLQRLVDEPAFLLAGDQDEDAPSANHAMVLSNLAVMSALTTAILGACERAYVSLRAIAGQQYFLPFALIAMSIVARIANCMRIVVGGQLTRMEAVAVEISTVVRAVDNEDVGERVTAEATVRLGSHDDGDDMLCLDGASDTETAISFQDLSVFNEASAMARPHIRDDEIDALFAEAPTGNEATKLKMERKEMKLKKSGKTKSKTSVATSALSFFDTLAPAKRASQNAPPSLLASASSSKKKPRTKPPSTVGASQVASKSSRSSNDEIDSIFGGSLFKK